nr:4Fe-4S binding protein [Candidatus Sigynarchaeota archaeon]
MVTETTEIKPASRFQGMQITIARRIVQVFVFIFLNATFWSSVLGTDLVTFENIFKFVPFLSSPRSEFSNSGGFLELIFGSMVARVFPFFLFGLLMFITVMFGRASCGWLCPAGFFQDIIAWIGHVTKSARDVGLEAHRFFIKLKNYLLLLLFIIIVPFLFIANNTIYNDYLNVLGDFGKNPLGFWSLDEYVFVFLPRLGKGLLDNNGLDFLFSNWVFIIQAFFYLFIIVLSFYYPRMYCRYLCPYAAITRPFAKFSVVALSRNPARCVGRKSCGKCETVCPMQIRLLDDPYTKISGNGECISCGKCMEACNKAGYNAVELSFFK